MHPDVGTLRDGCVAGQGLVSRGSFRLGSLGALSVELSEARGIAGVHGLGDLLAGQLLPDGAAVRSGYRHVHRAVLVLHHPLVVGDDGHLGELSVLGDDLACLALGILQAAVNFVGLGLGDLLADLRGDGLLLAERVDEPVRIHDERRG